MVKSRMFLTYCDASFLWYKFYSSSASNKSGYSNTRTCEISIDSTSYVIVITHQETNLSWVTVKTQLTLLILWFCFDCAVDSFPFSHLDEASFNLISFENACVFVDFDGQRYQSLCFNRLDSIHRAGNLNDLDPDTNCCRSSSICVYFIEDQLNESISLLWFNGLKFAGTVNFLILFPFRTAIPHPFLF